MKTLIIHIGAPKCGSSSIQEFFQTYENPCTSAIKFVMLKSKMISSLNSSNESDNLDFIKFLEKINIKKNDSLILSHEELFLKPLAIGNICKFSSSKFSRIIIIGFCRKSSDFLVSAYNQWEFRNVSEIKESTKILLENKINPLYFFGVERFVISYILNDFNSRSPQVMDWDNSFKQIEQFVTKHKAEMRIGILSNINSSKTLIQKFCEKADLILKEKYNSIDIKSNLKFNSHLTESISNALEFGFNGINPHEYNHILHDTSKLINRSNDFNSSLIIPLKDYIDSYYYESNIDFCNKYGFDKQNFTPSKVYSKNEIIELIKNEMETRMDNNLMLNYYKELTGIMAEALLISKINKKQQKKRNINFRKLFQ